MQEQIFKLSPTLFNSLYTYLQNRPFSEVSEAMPTFTTQQTVAEPVIQAQLLQNITTYLCKRPYSEVFELIVEILKLKVEPSPQLELPLGEANG
jgi:hypothetical protein